MRIINARIYTMDGPQGAQPIPCGFVDIREGKITAVGPMPAAGEAPGEVLDAAGAWLLPGLVDAHTHLGMWEDGLGFEGDDGNEETDPATPQLRAIDAVNPLDRCFEEARAAGVTTVVTGPGSANPIGGQLCAVKTFGRRLDDMVVRAPVAMKMALGENPKTVYHGKSQTPVTRMATAAIIRENLALAARYARDKRRAAEDPEAEEPEYDSKCEALLPVVEGRLPVHFHAHRADDIFTAVRIAEEFHLKYVLVHGTEAHLVTDLLAETGAPVLCGPLLCDRSKPELRALTPANPGLVRAAGLPIGIITDHPVIPLQYLGLCAGLAVREGLPFEEALRAVTIGPAEICGIDDRVGSIRAGKDADLALFPGNPLTLEARPLAVFGGGKRLL